MIYISDKKEIKSEVETALIRTCFLNLFSLDQIPQLRYSANAKYGMSFRCLPNINFRVVESFLNKENRTFASTQTLRKCNQKCCANFIYSHPRLFHSSATPSLTLPPRSKQSSSVNVEFSSILSNFLTTNSPISITSNPIGNEYINNSFRKSFIKNASREVLTDTIEQ